MTDVSIIGVPDPVLGEVVTRTSKVPRHVEIVAEFPLTDSGKVQKVETYGFSGPA